MATSTLQASQNSRISALQDKHAKLSNRVKEAQQSPGMPDDVIQLLKKEKLMLKEKIAGIRA